MKKSKIKAKKIGITAAVATSMVCTMAGSAFATVTSDVGNQETPEPVKEVKDNTNKQKPNNIIEGETQHKDAQAKVDEVKGEKIIAEENVTDKKETLANADKTVKEKANLVAEKEKAIANLNKQLEDAKIKQQEAIEKVNTATKAKEDADKNLAKLREEHPNAAAQIESDKAAVERAKKDKADKEKIAQEASNKIETAKTELKNKKKEVADLKEKLDVARAEVRKITDEKAAKDRELAAANETLDKLKREHPNDVEAVEAATEEVENAKKAVNTAATNLSEKTQAVETAETTLAEKRKEAESQNEKVNKAKVAFDQAKADAEEAETKLNEAKAAKQAAVKEVEKAQQVLDAANKEKMAADKAVETAEAELQRAIENSTGSGMTVEEARRAVEEAKAALEQSKADARAEWNKGTKGFYEKQGWQKAAKLFDDLDVVNENDNTPGKLMRDYTHMGKKGDATNLDNIKIGVEIVKLLNEKRALGGKNGEQLNPFKISPELMVYAQIVANWVDGQHELKHPNPGVPAISESLSSTGNPKWSVDMWYGEKSIYDEAVNNTEKYPGLASMSLYEIYQNYPELFFKTGHYLNVVDPNSNAVGAASSNCSSQENDNMNDAVSVEVFENALNTYISNLKSAMENGSIEAKNKLETAKANLEAIESAGESPEVVHARANLAEKKAEQDAKAQAINEATNNLAAKQEKVNEAEADLKAKTKSKTDADNKVTEATNILNDEKIAKSGTDAAVTDAETALSAAKNEKTKAEAAKTAADERLANANTDLDNRKKDAKDIVDAQAKVTELTGEVNALQTKLTEANGKKDRLTNDVSAKETEVNDATTNVSNLESAKNNAEADVVAATQTLTDAENTLRSDEEANNNLVNAMNEVTAKEQALEEANRNKGNADAVVDEIVNTKIPAAETAKTDAETALTDAETVKTDAQTALTDAETALANKETELNRAIGELAAVDGQVADLLVIEEGNGAIAHYGQTIVLKCNGSLEYFKGIYIDGTLIPVGQYEKKSGSTIITLSKDYVKTLAPGKHSFTFHYAYGDSETGIFTAMADSTVSSSSTPGTTDTVNITNITKKKTPATVNKETPVTGDETLIYVEGGLLLASVSALYIAGRKKKSLK